MTVLLRYLLRVMICILTSDNDAFDDWSLETALTAWEYGGPENERQEMAAWEMAAKEMTAGEE